MANESIARVIGVRAGRSWKLDGTRLASLTREYVIERASGWNAEENEIEGLPKKGERDAVYSYLVCADVSIKEGDDKSKTTSSPLAHLRRSPVPARKRTSPARAGYPELGLVFGEHYERRRLQSTRREREKAYHQLGGPALRQGPTSRL